MGARFGELGETDTELPITANTPTGATFSPLFEAMAMLQKAGVGFEVRTRVGVITPELLKTPKDGSED